MYQPTATHSAADGQAAEISGATCEVDAALAGSGGPAAAHVPPDQVSTSGCPPDGPSYSPTTKHSETDAQITESRLAPWSWASAGSGASLPAHDDPDQVSRRGCESEDGPLYSPATKHSVGDAQAADSGLVTGSALALAGTGALAAVHDDPDPVSRSPCWWPEVSA